MSSAQLQQQQPAYPTVGNPQPSQPLVQHQSTHQHVAQHPAQLQQPSQPPMIQITRGLPRGDIPTVPPQQAVPSQQSSPYHQGQSSPYHQGVPVQQPLQYQQQPPHYNQGVPPQQPPPGQQVIIQQPAPLTIAQTPPESAAQVAGYGKFAFVFAIVITIFSLLLCWPAAFCSGIGIYFAATSMEKLSQGDLEDGKNKLKWSLSCTSCSLTCVCVGFVLVMIVATSG